MEDISFTETSSVIDETDVSLNISISEGGETHELSTKSANPPEAASGTSCSAARKTYRCQHCNYSTFHRANLHRHNRAVHLKQKYACDTCTRHYSSKYDLVEHIRSSHQNVTLLCEVCSKTFGNRKALSLHKIRIHATRTKYQCRYCFKTMQDKGHYHGHVNSHVNSKPYSCTTCSKSYAYKTSLNRHTVKCKGDTDKYKCPQCDKVLSSIGALRDHEKGKHGPKDKFCKCGKAFAWRTSLTRHQKKCRAIK